LEGDKNAVKGFSNVNFLRVPGKRKVNYLLCNSSDLRADEIEQILINCMWKSKKHSKTPDHGDSK
jgi:hypothetical protein